MPLDVTRPGQADLMKSLPQSKWTRAKSIPGRFIVASGEFTEFYRPGETWTSSSGAAYQVQPDLSIRRLTVKRVSKKAARKLKRKQP